MSVSGQAGPTAAPEAPVSGVVAETELKAGAIGFLGKPFNEGCLIRCLDTALSGFKGRPQ